MGTGFFGDHEVQKSNPEYIFSEIDSNYRREFSKGKSFKVSIWNEVDTYNNDDFIQDFVIYNQALWARIDPTPSINEIPTEPSWAMLLEGVAHIEFEEKDNKVYWKYEDESEWKVLFSGVSEEVIIQAINKNKETLYDSELNSESTNAVQNKVVTTALENKVDKEEGKGLSSNDYTTDEKNKLANLENYDDSELKREIANTYQPIGDYLTEIPPDYIKKDDLVTINNQSLIKTSDNTNIELNLSGIYQSNITDKDLTMEVDYGDFKKGETKVGDLSGKKTYDELFDGILFPTKNPTHTNPSVSEFKLKSSGPVILGTNVIGISEASLNRGKWKEYNNDLSYTGDIKEIKYNCTINDKSYSNINNLPSVYTTLGDHTYAVTVSYNSGPVPKNNKGEDVPSLASNAGSVSASRTVNVTLPWYASTDVAGESTEQSKSIIPWKQKAGDMVAGGTEGFKLKPHTTKNPQLFEIPRQVFKIQTFKAGAGFDETEKSEWKETVVNKIINGFTEQYYRYEYTGAESRGEVTLIVNF